MATTNNLQSEPVNCPFLAQPCPQGNAQGMQCQFRVAQDFDPLHRLHDFEVIYCAVCEQQVRVISPESLSEK